MYASLSVMPTYVYYSVFELFVLRLCAALSFDFDAAGLDEAALA